MAVDVCVSKVDLVFEDADGSPFLEVEAHNASIAVDEDALEASVGEVRAVGALNDTLRSVVVFSPLVTATTTSAAGPFAHVWVTTRGIKLACQPTTVVVSPQLLGKFLALFTVKFELWRYDCAQQRFCLFFFFFTHAIPDVESPPPLCFTLGS